MYNPKRDPSERYWNMFTAAMIVLVVGWIGFQTLRYALRDEPKPRAPTIDEIYIAPGDECSNECMILLPPEVSIEPDYRIGRGEECQP